MPINITNIIVQSVILSFSGGKVTSATIQYTIVGAPEGWSAIHQWSLNTGESNGSTGFVTSLINRLQTDLGLTATTA